MSKLAVGLMLLGIEAWSGYAGAETEGNVVARVGDHLVLRSDVDKALQRLPEDKRPTRQELLQTLIDRQILLLEATRRQQGPRVRQAVEQSRKKRAVERLLDREVDSDVLVSEEEITSVYDQAGYESKREVRGRHIMVQTREQADRIYRALHSGADFAELARESSIEGPSAELGGDMGYWDETLMVGDVAARLFALEIGELSEPFGDTRGYFHIVRAEEARPLAYETVRRRIENRLRDSRLLERRSSYVSELAKRRNLRTEDSSLLRLIQINKTATHGVPWQVEAADLDRVLLRYKGGEVRLSQYLRWVEILPPNRRPVAVDTASTALFARRTTIDSLLLPLEAQSQGLSDDAVMDAYLARRGQELAIEELRRVVAEEAFVNEESLRSYYEEHIERYTIPDIVLYEGMLLHAVDDGERVAEQVRAGADMWQLSHQYRRFYDKWRHYGVFHIHQVEEENESAMARVMAAVRNAKVGEVGGPYAVSFPRGKDRTWRGYMVFQVLERRPERVDDFDSPTTQRELAKLVRAPYAAQIEERFETFLTGLRQDYESQVQIYPERPRP